MKKSFRHKGLKRLFEKDDARGISSEHQNRIENILFRAEYSRRCEGPIFAWLRPASPKRGTERVLIGKGIWKLAHHFPV